VINAKDGPFSKFLTHGRLPKRTLQLCQELLNDQQSPGVYNGVAQMQGGEPVCYVRRAVTPREAPSVNLRCLELIFINSEGFDF
jgi:hypothetical protein